MNKMIVVGRMGSDPEVRYTQGGSAVAHFNVATKERWNDKSGNKQERTEWHRVILWGKTAEFAGQYCKKGDLVLCEGPIRTQEWTNNAGQKQFTKELHANVSFEKLSWDDRSGGGSGGEAPAAGGGSGGYDQFNPGGGAKHGTEEEDDFPF